MQNQTQRIRNAFALGALALIFSSAGCANHSNDTSNADPSYYKGKDFQSKSKRKATAAAWYVVPSGNPFAGK